MSRRTFAKAAAVTGVAAALATGVAPLRALAEGEATTQDGEVQKIRSCCRGCGKTECGVWVYVQNGKVIRTEGDEAAFNSMGQHCSKGQASIQASYHPDRIKYPMKRTNPKGDSDPGWVRISWDEAYQTIADNLLDLREKHGAETLFAWCGTGRQWCMQSDAGMALQLFSSPNIIAAYQVCKGPRHFASGLDISRAWSWSEVINHSNVYLNWATGPEISNYDDSARLVIDCATKADTFIDIDPRLANLGKEADYWLNLRPGTDSALALAWCNVIYQNKLWDDLYVKRWTNAPFILVKDMEPTGYGCMSNHPFDMKSRLLTEVDIDPSMVDWQVEGEGNPYRYLVWDTLKERWTYWQADPADAHWEGETWKPQTKGKKQDVSRMRPNQQFEGWIADPSPFDPLIDPALTGEFDVKLKNGTSAKGRVVWDIWLEEISKYTPEYASEITGIDPKTIEESALAWATRKDPDLPNGGIYYGLGVEHAGNSTQNCRAILAACGMVGAIDTPGGQRGPTQGWAGQSGPTSMLPSMASFAFMPTPEVGAKLAGADKMPLLGWYSVWCDAETAMRYVHQEPDSPYFIHGGMIGSGDHMNMGNASYNWEALQMLDFLFEANLWHSPTSGMADILLPVAHWTEINGHRIAQGASGGFLVCVKVVEPPGECKSDPLYFLELSEYFGVPAFDGPEPWPKKTATVDPEILSLNIECGQYATWIKEVLDDIPNAAAPELAQWVKTHYTEPPAPDQVWECLVRDFQEHGPWSMKEAYPDDWGTYRRHETGQAYRPGMHQVATQRNIGIPGFPTPTMKQELYSTIIETFHDDPDLCLPHYTEPVHGPVVDVERYKEYPIQAITGRRIPVYFHSEHRQLPWCRELWPVPRMEINPADAEQHGLKQGDWVWIESEWGKIRQTADLFYGIEPGTINLEHQWWYPELAQADKGFALSCCNCLVDTSVQDKYNGSSVVRTYPVKIYKATPENSPFGNPIPCGEDGTEIISDSTDPRLKAWTIGGPGIHPDSFNEGEEPS
jgi:anaerobic selenocysteine-containing dehydrogenase